MGRLRRLVPRTFQGRLTLAFVAILALTLSLVTVGVLDRLGDYFDQQQREDLTARSLGVAQYVALVAESASTVRPVVGTDNVVDPGVVVQLTRSTQQRILADRLAKADVLIRLGTLTGGTFMEASGGEFRALLQAGALVGQTREPITSDTIYYTVNGTLVPYVVEVTLSNPYTYRATALATTTGLLAVIGLIALAVSISAGATLARRITVPIRRLTEASRGLAEGDLARRVPDDPGQWGSTELIELATQFNTMADRVQESVEIIRHDRDRSRDFLADVSHELRTPIAALRTFNELLRERAGEDPTARTEFLEASGVQLERLDWLAQNLLELSRLDSGLVLLDLRPDDLRSTVEQAVEQAEPAARRRGIDLAVHLPEHPLRIQHDPVRIGQVVANLVGNAIKFTPRGGHIGVAVGPAPEGVKIVVTDTGVGIDAAELPHIFERFYRGTRASEARGSGSGLGLAIVRSIVEMHGGTVGVESRLNAGSTFTVLLPRDPRRANGTNPGHPVGGDPIMAETSSSATLKMNPDTAP
ncbi:MAG: HAMP domain-containing histidine kinase [Chloroflexi bacterium]|nr:HAMP domain-containing histidine kinase [Chloroflexota bacterium]